MSMESSSNKKVPMFRSKYGAVNRKHRRLYKKEERLVYYRLYELELFFLEDLFIDLPISYKELYIHYLDEWHRLTDWMVRMKMFKHTIINIHYFEEQYKPIEDE